MITNDNLSAKRVTHDTTGINKCAKCRKVKGCKSHKCSSPPIVYDTVTQTRSPVEKQLFQVHQGKPIASVVLRLAKSVKTSHNRYIKKNIITVAVMHNMVIKLG